MDGEPPLRPPNLHRLGPKPPLNLVGGSLTARNGPTWAIGSGNLPRTAPNRRRWSPIPAGSTPHPVRPTGLDTGCTTGPVPSCVAVQNAIHTIQRVRGTVGVRVTVRVLHEQFLCLLHRRSRPSTLPFLPGSGVGDPLAVVCQSCFLSASAVLTAAKPLLGPFSWVWSETVRRMHGGGGVACLLSGACAACCGCGRCGADERQPASRLGGMMGAWRVCRTPP